MYDPEYSDVFCILRDSKVLCPWPVICLKYVKQAVKEANNAIE